MLSIVDPQKENQPVSNMAVDEGPSDTQPTKTESVCPDADRGLELTSSDKFKFSAEAASGPPAHPTTAPQGNDPQPGADGQAPSPAPGKRTFSDVEKSPEAAAAGTQAKRANTAYEGAFQTPPEERPSGLTGAFSTVLLEDLRASPGISSPLGVTKNLFGELHDPAEDVFLAPGPEDSSFTSDKELCRNLCLDSDGSQNESSGLVGESPTSEASSPSCRRRSTPSPGAERTGGREASTEPTPQRPNLFRRGELQSPCLGRAPAGATTPPSAAPSPCFLKPRPGVAFRSYCSSISRSNFSSHSVESMDTSSMPSFVTGGVTPVQRTHSSNGSRYQVGRRMRMMMMMMCNANHSSTVHAKDNRHGGC